MALANWYSPFSETLTGKHSSMVPPLGGILIGVGIFLVTGSWGYALLALLLDLGMPFFLIAIVYEMWDALKNRKDKE